MPFLAQIGHEHSFLPELISNGDLEGVVVQIAHGGPGNLGDVSARGGMVLVDPQTYKLGDANVRLTEKMTAQPFVALWPSATELSDPSRRLPFVASTLDAQLELGATDLISPYLFIEDVSGPAMESTLQMAEDAYRAVASSRRIWAGLYVSGGELKRQQRRDQLLNEVTSSSINHCYLVVDPEQAGNGPIADEDLIAALRHVVRVLESNDIRVMLGYSDPVGLLLMADGLSAFASGVRASLRRLRMAAQRRGGGGGRPPHVRYYVSQLLNFVRVDSELAPALSTLTRGQPALCQCRYCLRNLYQFSQNQQFDNSDGHRHYVARLTEDARSLAEVEPGNRPAEVNRLIDEAMASYGRLAEAGITLVGDAGNEHLQACQKAFTSHP